MSIKNKYRVIFAGTPEFAVPALQYLIREDYHICAIYTQPDRPAGRGRQLKESPVKHCALEHHIPVYQPKELKSEDQIKKLQDLQADIMIVVAYGLLLPKAVLDAPRMGCINIHASLLPRWRGASPIQQAILAGDTETGITVIKMVEELDAGPILSAARCQINAADTSQVLHDRLALIGAQQLIDTLPVYLKGKIKPVAQDESKVSYAHKMTKEQAKIDWALSAVSLDRAVRAYNPWPVAYTLLPDGKRLRIWASEVIDIQANEYPGSIVHVDKNGLDVATGDGVLRIHELQLSGGRRMTVRDFLNAHKLPNGMVIGEQENNN